MKKIVLLVLGFLCLGTSSKAQLSAYLTPAEVTALMSPYSVPADIAAAVWRPDITSQWKLSPPARTILGVPGADTYGGSPGMLASPVPYTGPFVNHIIPIPTGEDWRIGYVNLPIKGGGTQKVSFLVKLPPDWNPSSPASTITEIVQFACGSGDCRGRSLPLDLEGFNPPGTLFFVFDQRFLSLGMDAPGNLGSTAFKEGLNYIRNTLGLSHDTDVLPWHVWGYSAGGGCSMTAIYNGAEKATSVVAFAPVILPWDVYDNNPYLAPPGAPVNPWAYMFSLGTISPDVYANYFGFTIVPLIKYGVPENIYNKENPFTSLGKGIKPKPPVLLIAGSNDDLGTATGVVSPFTVMAHYERNTARPIAYGPADVTAGRVIDWEQLVADMHNKGNVAALIIRGGTHELTTPWGTNVWELALEYSRAVAAGAP